jgi:hypothetical protein
MSERRELAGTADGPTVKKSWNPTSVGYRFAAEMA